MKMYCALSVLDFSHIIRGATPLAIILRTCSAKSVRAYAIIMSSSRHTPKSEQFGIQS
ncbi:MAG TPA: hypothetical protein PLP06_08730 [Saprospiraceae bacterium]|nr:hypothetical protein [Saprospiraceae bacterium]